MKVTTELKRLIHTQFEKERDAATRDLEEKMKQDFDVFCAEVEASPEWRAFVSAREGLYEKYKGLIVGGIPKAYPPKGTPCASSNVDGFKCSRVKDYFYMWSRGSTEFPANFKFTQQAEDSLLVRLTYERELERVQALLAEYGLEL